MERALALPERCVVAHLGLAATFSLTEQRTQSAPGASEVQKQQHAAKGPGGPGLPSFGHLKLPLNSLSICKMGLSVELLDF